MRDVRSILALAYPRPDTSANALRCFLPPRSPASKGPESVEEYIDSVIAARPLATYASLAGAVLTAAFVGLPATTAVFTEAADLISPVNDSAR